MVQRPAHPPQPRRPHPSRERPPIPPQPRIGNHKNLTPRHPGRLILRVNPPPPEEPTPPVGRHRPAPPTLSLRRSYRPACVEPRRRTSATRRRPARHRPPRSQRRMPLDSQPAPRRRRRRRRRRGLVPGSDISTPAAGSACSYRHGQTCRRTSRTARRVSCWRRSQAGRSLGSGSAQFSLTRAGSACAACRRRRIQRRRSRWQRPRAEPLPRLT